MMIQIYNMYTDWSEPGKKISSEFWDGICPIIYFKFFSLKINLYKRKKFNLSAYTRKFGKIR